MAKTLPQTRIPVSDPRRGFDAFGPEFGATIERVIRSGRYVHGPEHNAFEAELAAFLGVSHCASVASGTDALELALAAVGCTPGDEVVTAANAGGYTTAAASRLRLPGALRRRRSHEARAHRRHGRAGADGCHSSRRRHSHLRTDVRRRGDRRALSRPRHRCRRGLRPGGRSGRGTKRAGSFADAAALSFYPTKNLAASGPGSSVPSVTLVTCFFAPPPPGRRCSPWPP